MTIPHLYISVCASVRLSLSLKLHSCMCDCTSVYSFACVFVCLLNAHFIFRKNNTLYIVLICRFLISLCRVSFVHCTSTLFATPFNFLPMQCLLILCLPIDTSTRSIPTISSSLTLFFLFFLIFFYFTFFLLFYISVLSFFSSYLIFSYHHFFSSSHVV